MAGIEPNDDFLKDNTAVNKPIEIPADKPIPKMKNKGGDVKSKVKAKTTKAKEKQPERQVISQEQYDLEKAKYPEYFALSDYHKKCLIATNYWRVINGKPIIEVPALYTYYHKHFDKRCYDLAKDYQEKKERMASNNTTLGKVSDEDKIIEVLVKVEKNEMYAKDAVDKINEINGVEPIPESKEIIIDVTNIEVKKEEVKPKKAKAKAKVETVPEPTPEIKIEEIYKEAVERFPSTMEKLEDDKKDDEPQLSLF